MEWNRWLLLLVCFLIEQSHAYVEIFQYRKNWIEAKNECFNKGGRLAHPDDLYTNICSNQSINVWTGKYDHERPTPWIAKFGCFFRDQASRRSKSPLVECYSSCKLTSFGFMNPWCSCENETRPRFVSFTTCSISAERRNPNALWFYNKTQTDVSNDDYMLDCITAQCTENGTIFKAVNCNSKKFTYCQGHGFNSTATRTTQAKSERFCNGNEDILISKQICSSFHISDRKTPEFWTGIQRYRYKVTKSLTDNDRKDVNSTDIYNCVYVECESGNKPVEYTENCRRQLDWFACIFNGSSNNVTTVKPSHVSSVASANSSSSKIFESTSATLDIYLDQSSKHAVDASVNNVIIGPTSVYSSSENWFASAIISSSEFSSIHLEHVSTGVSPQSTIETSVYVGIRSSVLMSEQSNIGSNILPTSVTSKLFSDYSSKHVVRAYINTSSKLAINSNIDMSSSVYSLSVKNKSGTELNERKNMHSTTIRNINNSKRPQFSTGLIVGVSISIFVVLIIGVIGICRLRHQGLFKEKHLNYTIPMTKINDPNYQDIDVDIKKEKHVIGNDSTQSMIATTDHNKQFDTTNGTTNIPNDVYAVMEKNGISSTSKTEKNQDKDENPSSNKPESDNYSLHQSRRISGNESNNIYDTSGGHNDDNDPTYNTTTHVHARERANESD